jgi:hypothetical protein
MWPVNDNQRAKKTAFVEKELTMNTEYSGKKYIWLLLLAGMGGQTVGTSLFGLQNDAFDFLGGFLLGLSCVALGAFIFLAVSTLRNGSVK